MAALEEIEAIKQLKYRYLRCLDTKDWNGLADTLTDDVRTAYGGGTYSFEGREAVVGFLRDALGSPQVVSLHQCHHPEIELTSETGARGIWYLEDRIIRTDSDSRLRGAAFYEDEYAKVNGAWKIRSTGYERVFEERFEQASSSLKTRFDP